MIPSNKFNLSKFTKSGTPYIVAIGASAGGLSAIEAIFNNLPANGLTEIAFVVVQHYDPHYKSLLQDILKNQIQLPVVNITHNMPIKAGSIYIRPSDSRVEVENNHFLLSKFIEGESHANVIDHFFFSVTKMCGPDCCGIVLSGQGNDGTDGLIAINKNGGLTIAQLPYTCEFDSMPLNAIDSGCVDYILSPNEVGSCLISTLDSNQIEKTESHKDFDYQQIIRFLYLKMGHDFSNYKANTLQRRIDRRCLVNLVQSNAEYFKLLKQSEQEVEALFRDLLIGVTHFFRDSFVFEKLKRELLPNLIKNKPSDAPLRIWCTGCSTGEEAYSIAIIISESQYANNVQIFATDIDARAISIARKGVYPLSIENSVDSQRLEKNFNKLPNQQGYKVNATIRQMVVFSEQSLIKDPPLSHIDLITCRNLFIYLNQDLQHALIRIFHYALQPQGLLVLGTSETVHQNDSLFKMVDQKCKIFERKRDFDSRINAFKYNIPQLAWTNRLVPSAHASPNIITQQHLVQRITEYAMLELNLGLATLVTEEGTVMYTHGDASFFMAKKYDSSDLERYSGLCIWQIVHDKLRRVLKAALKKSVLRHVIYREINLPIIDENQMYAINITIMPIDVPKYATMENTVYFIYLDKIHQDADTMKSHEIILEQINASESLAGLEHYMQELVGANDSMQTLIEELQSANEELETSREELQAINEELSNVNSELESQITTLSRVNDDMNNLLLGSNIATVFLDFDQRIMRFTPATVKIIKLIPTDIGRPIGDLATRIVGYNRLEEDVCKVLQTLKPIELQIMTQNHTWFNMIIHPYRTVENIVEGVVLTFVDITESKLISQELVALKKQLSVLEESKKTHF